MKSIIILISFIGIGTVQGADRVQFIETGSFECEGKDPANYTFIAQWTDNAACSETSYQGTGPDYLIGCQQNGQKVVNVLDVLVISEYPSGGLYDFHTLYLAVSGNLEGKFLYFKEIGSVDAYFKKCSSVLGYSYRTTKSQILLIADKLDPNVLISPIGAFEQFKKSATTTCQGKSITV